MSYIQASVASRTVYVTLADVPATGVQYTDVVVQVKKQGQNAFTTKTLLLSEWVELAAGIYSISFSASDTDTVGDFTYTLTSTFFDNIAYDEFTIVPPPPASTPAVLPAQCVISGNIATIMATPPTQEPLKIVFWPPQFPAKFAQTILTAQAVYTFADAYGNFSVALVRKSTVIVEIKRCGIRCQIVIPDSPTANLLDLLPPFVIDYSL